VIGGGPTLNSATVMFLKGSAKRFDLRAVDAQGREVLQLGLSKPARERKKKAAAVTG